MSFNIGITLFFIGVLLYSLIGFWWAFAYDQECATPPDNLLTIGAFWPMMLLWMLILGLFCTINKWYRWATKR